MVIYGIYRVSRDDTDGSTECYLEYFTTPELAAKAIEALRYYDKTYYYYVHKLTAVNSLEQAANPVKIANEIYQDHLKYNSEDEIESNGC